MVWPGRAASVKYFALYLPDPPVLSITCVEAPFGPTLRMLSGFDGALEILEMPKRPPSPPSVPLAETGPSRLSIVKHRAATANALVKRILRFMVDCEA